MWGGGGVRLKEPPFPFKALRGTVDPQPRAFGPSLLLFLQAAKRPHGAGRKNVAAYWGWCDLALRPPRAPAWGHSNAKA